MNKTISRLFIIIYVFSQSLQILCTIGLVYFKQKVGGAVDIGATGRVGLLITQSHSSKKWQRAWDGG